MAVHYTRSMKFQDSARLYEAQYCRGQVLRRDLALAAETVKHSSVFNGQPFSVYLCVFGVALWLMSGSVG